MARIGKTALERPVPDMTELRRRKAAEGYRHLPVDTTDQRYHERLVSVGVLGVAGQSYYTRPNGLTGEPVPGVPAGLVVRRSVLTTLFDVNDRLRDRVFAEVFGAPVELYVEEGLRPAWLQARLWDQFLEALLARGMGQAEAERLRGQLIAAPSTDQSASPHASGGAVDVVLRYRRETPKYDATARLWLGFDDGELSERLWPDWYEVPEHVQTERDREAQYNRRVLYAVMTGAAFGLRTGFTVNPTEIFHWDQGDLLWAMCTGRPAYYGLAGAADQLMT